MSWPPRWKQRQEQGFGNPERPFHRMLEDIFDAPEEARGHGAWAPRVDLRETEDAYVVTAELPGISAEQVDVSVAGERITICGDRPREEGSPQERRHVLERPCGLFHREITLPEPVENVDAEMKHGVLTIRAAKSATRKPHRIKVRAHS